MSIDEARQVIRDPQASFMRRYEAAVELTASPQATDEDLLACLKYRGVTAEIGAIALYLRTQRPRLDDSPVSLVTDHADWANYLERTRGE
jgi:hypothetical protein